MRNVLDYGAKGDGRSDDTAAVRRALREAGGPLLFPPGDYRIEETLKVDLGGAGRFGIDGSGGGATVVMAGPGPAFHLAGSHAGTADPGTLSPAVRDLERMPTVIGLCVQGRHPEADGFLFEGAMQPTLERALLRGLRHAVRLTGRARNVLISACHIYDNRGVGVFLDAVNLHQVIVSASHISYCRGGGIRIVASQIRNLQVTGNDIEYNHDPEAGESADIWIDSSAPEATVREGTISSNTIQALPSPGGANLRMVGHGGGVNRKAGMFAVTGNLIGPQETNIHLEGCRGMVVSGNVVFGGSRHNLRVTACRNILATGNSFDHNPDYPPDELCTGVRIEDSEACTLSDCHVMDESERAPEGREALIEIHRCRSSAIRGCRVRSSTLPGIRLADTRDVDVTDCAVSTGAGGDAACLAWTGRGAGNRLIGNRFRSCKTPALAVGPDAGVSILGNAMG